MADRSRVTVVFLDGEVREYEISAGSTISKYLVEQAAELKILCFFDRKQKTSFNVPLANIREWTIETIYEEKDNDK
jgi:hypothetical protein